MKNIEQLLNKENWIKYLELADEGGITNHGIAQDIVSKIEQAINYSQCCTTLPNEEKSNSRISWEIFDKHYDQETCDLHTKHWNFMEGIKLALEYKK